MKSALIDLAALECLDAFPRDLDRLLVVVQISPRRREALQRAFPGAEIVETWPPGDGPWQDAVERTLAELGGVDESFRGVPLLECLTELWRSELEKLFTLDHMWPSGELVVASSSPWFCLSGQLAALQAGRILTAVTQRQIRHPGLAAKTLGLGVRGWALALESRLDPARLRRAHFSLVPKVSGTADALMVSSYVNTTRAILRFWSNQAEGTEAVLVETGPLACHGVHLPGNVRRLSVARTLAGQVSGAKPIVQLTTARAAGAFRAWHAELGASGTKVAVSLLLSGARFVEQLGSAHLPGLISTILAIDSLVNRLGVPKLIVGNEFGASERAALRYAVANGLEAYACQHGVIDGHYRRERVIADVFWTWDRASSDLLVEWGAGPPERFREMEDLVSSPPRSQQPSSRQDVVLFCQPYELVPLSPGDFMNEVVPPLAQACSMSGARLVVKPHPLQTRRQLSSWLKDGARHVTNGRRPMEVLSSAAAAVVLDSSVVVDCRLAGVPCLSVGWYPGHYGEELAKLGYVTRARSPEHLQQLVTRILGDRPC